MVQTSAFPCLCAQRVSQKNVTAALGVMVIVARKRTKASARDTAINGSSHMRLPARVEAKDAMCSQTIFHSKASSAYLNAGPRVSWPASAHCTWLSEALLCNRALLVHKRLVQARLRSWCLADGPVAYCLREATIVHNGGINRFYVDIQGGVLSFGF
jgi:hypothetical protein